MVGLGGDDGARSDRQVVGALDVEGLDQGGQHQGGLGQRELGADAHPRADAERQIGETAGRRRIGHEPLGVEGVGRAP